MKLLKEEVNVEINQKERMLAGLPYKAWLDGLGEERIENKLRIYDYNLLRPDEANKMDELLKDILGKTGDKIFIGQPFHCDYGKNIEIGNNFFANYILYNIRCWKGDNW